MNKQRIFISVLPGNKNQIETLKEKRYPNKTNQKGGDTSNTYFSKYLRYKQKYIRLKKLLNL